MRRVTSFLALVATVSLGCGNGDDTFVPAPKSATGDASADATVADAARPTDGTTEATRESGVEDADAATLHQEASRSAETHPASVRVANWSPDAPPVDFCLAPHGTTAFEGPLLANFGQSTSAADGGDGGTGGLAYPQMSAYFVIDAGSYDARVVAAGADCGSGIIPDATSLPTLVVDGAETIALIGQAQPEDSDGGAPGLGLAGFVDEVIEPPTTLALRFVNAAPGLAAVDILNGNNSASPPLYLGIPFGQTGSAQEARAAVAADGAVPLVDSNGYETLNSPHPTLSFSARGAALPGSDAGAAGSIVTAEGNVTGAGGAIVTVALLSSNRNNPNDAGMPFVFLECVDNAGTVGPFSNCSNVSSK